MREFWQKLPFSNLTMKTNVALKHSGLLLWLKSEVSLTLTSIGGTYEESK
tara:strand:- start:672 stop:821 length:150 start_codon:yes stop_codon:yes gene_type:complete